MILNCLIPDRSPSPSPSCNFRAHSGPLAPFHNTVLTFINYQLIMISIAWRCSGCRPSLRVESTKVRFRRAESVGPEQLRAESH